MVMMNSYLDHFVEIFNFDEGIPSSEIVKVIFPAFSNDFTIARDLFSRFLFCILFPDIKT